MKKLHSCVPLIINLIISPTQDRIRVIIVSCEVIFTSELVRILRLTFYEIGTDCIHFSIQYLE